MGGIGRFRIARLLIGAGLAAALAACFGQSEDAEIPRIQGWTEEEQSWWYEATQGSRLMPFSWFQALEQAGNDRLFLDDAHMAGFRFLPRTTSFGARLPVGFAIDDNNDTELSATRLRWFDGQGPSEQWIGLNCSACHTGELTHDGQSIRIEGGPALVDFQSFIEAVDAALTATRDQPAKWERFAGRVLGARDNPANRALLRTALGQLIDWQARAEALNHTPTRYGFARLDAFGHIFNKIALFVGAEDPIVNPADAPVSYPFIWDIYRHDRLQWNGIAQNSRLNLGGGRFLDYGAMGRNTGEVIGVFGDIVVSDRQTLAGYRSSVWADNLDRLETQLRSLRPPAWPAEAFGHTPEPDLVSAGQAIYGQRCIGCHRIEAGTAPYEVQMVPLRANPANRTDPWMACNAFTYIARSGRLTGARTNYINGDTIEDIAPVSILLATTVRGALVGKKGQIAAQAANTFLGINRPPRVVLPADVVTDEQRQQARLATCLSENSPFLAYKARPLDGIWATAPYLHNGSVPSLFQLLLPPAQRQATFLLGT
ncbi:MAG TPA: di-heme-cytochrome C peroxidase, partial [Dongiaceae bacterium]|nr:di-heme-cytochrome C peroxidase [Dongiaceae bacterium]